jgi:ParB-like chromosome segregation protein Spo0J
MGLNEKGPASVATEDRARKSDQLDGSIASENNALATANQVSLQKQAKQVLLTAVAKMPSEATWRKALPVHPAANMVRPATPEEIRKLAGDLKQHGQRQPVVLVRINGGDVQLLDGRTRLDVQEALGVKVVDADGTLQVKSHTVDLPDDDAALAYVLSLNVFRRHLSLEERRQLAKDVLTATPEKSDRQIGKIVGFSPTTVGAVRSNMEAAGDVSKLDTSTDTKGRKQPRKRKINKVAKQPANTKVKPAAERLAAFQAHLRKVQDQLANEYGVKAAWQAANAKPVNELLQAAQNLPLAENLRAAEIKIAGLESEVQELKAENAKLREQLEAAKAMTS